MQISHESIYYHIYVQPKKEVEKLLISQLRQKRNYRGNVRRGADKRTTIKDPIRIDERPEEVLTREIPGHWEGDLVLGKNRESAIGTLVERTTRFLIIVFCIFLIKCNPVCTALFIYCSDKSFVNFFFTCCIWFYFICFIQ